MITILFWTIYGLISAIAFCVFFWAYSDKEEGYSLSQRALGGLMGALSWPTAFISWGVFPVLLVELTMGEPNKHKESNEPDC